MLKPVLNSRVAALLLLASAGVISKAQAFDTDGWANTGPLEIRNMRSISIPFLRIDQREPVLGLGQSDARIAFQAANDMRSLTYGAKVDYEDYEIDRLQLRYRRGIGDGADLTIEVQLLDRNGGFMDPVIEFWHRYVLGIQVALRDDTPYGQSMVDIPGHSPYGSSAGIGDTSVYLAKEFSGRLTAIAGLSLPTGNSGELLGAGAVDAGLSVQYRTVIHSSVVAYAHAGAIYQGPDRELPEARRFVHQEGVSLVWTRNSRDSVIGQWDSEASALVSGIPGSDSGHRMLSLGWRRKLSDRKWLDVYFSEDGDFVNYSVDPLVNIAPDFTVGFVYGCRF